MRLIALLLLAAGCAPRVDVAGAPPSLVVGSFVDDYDNAYRITERTWDHLGYARYHVVRWRPGAGYLIARNDDANPADGGLWTRIDWVRLDNAAPHE